MDGFVLRFTDTRIQSRNDHRDSRRVQTREHTGSIKFKGTSEAFSKRRDMWTRFVPFNEMTLFCLNKFEIFGSKCDRNSVYLQVYLGKRQIVSREEEKTLVLDKFRREREIWTLLATSLKSKAQSRHVPVREVTP